MADSIKVKLLDAQKNPILPETSADQVTMADGGNVETKIKALEGAVSGKVPCYVVNDIAARDGLESPKQGDLCWVKDATADATVSTGAAQYIYDGSAWVKIAEAESMDLMVNWADIQGKEAVEAAMGKAHEHANADLLNGISASGDTMTVNGKTYYSGRMVAIIENGGEIPADMNPNGIVFEKAPSRGQGGSPVSYIIKDAKGNKIGVLPDSLRVAQAAELRSLAGSHSVAIAAGTQFTVPQYEVGSVALEVFLDGVACMIGEQYAEVGSKGQTSTKIVWNIEIATDRDILVRCK